MHPTTTTYHLCTKPSDYKACHTLGEAAGSPKATLGFPTVYALRDNAIIGFLGTLKAKGQVICGPLVTDPTLKKPIFVALRLAEAYEQVLRQAGVTSYRLGVAKDQPEWSAAVHRAGFQPYAETPTDIWYERSLNGL